MSLDDSLPTDLASAHALIIAQRQALSAAEPRAATAESEAQYRALLIEKLKFTIRKLRHDRFGQSSERGALLDQLELQLADLEADAAQADTAGQMASAAASEKMMVPSFERRRPARRPLPEHLPRERIVYAPRLHSTSYRLNRAAIWVSVGAGLFIPFNVLIAPCTRLGEQVDSICRTGAILPRFSTPILPMRCNTLIFSAARLGLRCQNVSCLGSWNLPICSRVRLGRTFWCCSPASSWRRVG